MQFSPDLFSQSLLQVTWGLALLLLLVAARCAPWRAMLVVPVRQHALFAALVVLGLLWSFRFEVLPGLHCHPFLLMSVTLIFGWSFALLIGALALLLVALLGGHPWQALSLDWLFTVVLPATLSFVLMRMLYRLRLRNLFFYILGLGFFGTILITLLSCVMVWLFLAFTQSPAFMEQLSDSSAVIVPLLYSEGFLNGLLVTAITVFVPTLVKTFDEHYFR